MDKRDPDTMTDMARRIRECGDDSLKLNALAASLEQEARVLRDGPDDAPLTEEEKSHLIDPITGDRKRIFQPGELVQDRARAKELAEQHKKAQEVRKVADTAVDPQPAPKRGPAEGYESRPEPYRIGGEASEEEKATERGLADDQRAAQTVHQSAKPGPVNPVVQPATPISDGNAQRSSAEPYRANPVSQGHAQRPSAPGQKSPDPVPTFKKK